MQDVIVRSARLPSAVKKRARSILRLLQEAEDHSRKKSHAHFRDRGLALLDTLVDVLGSSWGFWRMGIDQVNASPLQTGRLAPAAAWLIQKRKIPIYRDTSRFEMATPTGVAILSVIVDKFRSTCRLLQLIRSGYGAGPKRDFRQAKRAGNPSRTASTCFYRPKTA